MRRRRDLTPQERALWRSVLRDVAPLVSADGAETPQSATTSPPAPEPGEPPATTSSGPPPRPAPKKAQKPSSHRAARPAVPRRPAPPPPLSPGHAPGLDRRSAERLRRGKLAVDDRIDLHGLGQDEARHRLFGFLRLACARGHRVVLVITGKGRPVWERGGDDSSHAATGLGSAERGVLRSSLPHWLNDPAVRDLVLAFHPARQRHGGVGATYVLLRKRSRPE